MKKQITQQMAATTSRRKEAKADLGGSMSMTPVIRPSTPTNLKAKVKRHKIVTLKHLSCKFKCYNLIKNVVFLPIQYRLCGIPTQ